MSDSGIGIPSDRLPYGFDRFRQADGSQSREFAGSGIGLALVEEIPAHYCGEVSAFSRYDSGSSFEVMIMLGNSHLSAATSWRSVTRVLQT